MIPPPPPPKSRFCHKFIPSNLLLNCNFAIKVWVPLTVRPQIGGTSPVPHLLEINPPGINQLQLEILSGKKMGKSHIIL